jgi:hypothetical protein
VLQLKWDEVRSIFNTLDKDGDRNVNWEEFFVSTSSLSHGIIETKKNTENRAKNLKGFNHEK